MAVLDGGSASGTSTSTTAPATITAEIVGAVQQQMQDQGATAWPAMDLMEYINLAILEIIKLDYTAYNITSDLQLVAGAKQTLPAGNFDLIDAVCNVSSAGVVGSDVTILPRKQIGTAYPNWQSATANNTIQNVIRDEFVRGIFYVFPPQPVSPSNLRAIMSALPPYVTSVDVVFPLDDTYKLAAINYVLFLVLREETTLQNAQAKAMACLGQFYKEMGVPAPPKKPSRGGTSAA